ncbi:hypothetical protein [Reinekea blandensis]|uniref:Uncharacterized protein n=1 Tax=Reinekea blandensis MED297 TaxID=314283 RepID=A4BE69_9GAMM|nr:hypothetical protein [Reinekea blandensis]EAR09547.1 hypothetical protein MED297_12487 [Reinekea blandensis MED297]
MDRNEPERPTLTAFIKVVSKTPESRRQKNRMTLKQLWRPEVREELSVQGVAILSDN